jgi:Immunity protein 27
MLFRDPGDDRYWERTYPQGEAQGGGPPPLIALSLEKLMRDMNSLSRHRVTILKRSVGALMALIGGLLVVGIGAFVLSLVTIVGNPRIVVSQKPIDVFLFAPLGQALVITCFAGIVATPIWLFFYLPCHLLIPRSSLLWRPQVCIPLGAIAGAAAFWVGLTLLTIGRNLSSGPWILNEAILAACVGACTCLVGSMIAKRSREKEKRTLVVGPEQR